MLGSLIGALRWWWWTLSASIWANQEYLQATSQLHVSIFNFGMEMDLGCGRNNFEPGDETDTTHTHQSCKIWATHPNNQLNN